MRKKQYSEDAVLCWGDSPRVDFYDPVPQGVVSFLRDLPIDPVELPWNYGTTDHSGFDPADTGDFQEHHFSVTKSGEMKPASGYEYQTQIVHHDGTHKEVEVRYAKHVGNYAWGLTHRLRFKL